MKPADMEKYLPYFDGSDLTHDQKIEYIQTVYCLIEQFCDLAFYPDKNTDLSELLKK